MLVRINSYARRFRQIELEFIHRESDDIIIMFHLSFAKSLMFLELYQSMRLKLIEERGFDKRRYNISTVDEVAVIIPGDESVLEKDRNLIVYLKRPTDNVPDNFKVIKDTSCLYAPLHYVLLFPLGKDGYSI